MLAFLFRYISARVKRSRRLCTNGETADDAEQECRSTFPRNSEKRLHRAFHNVRYRLAGSRAYEKFGYYHKREKRGDQRVKADIHSAFNMLTRDLRVAKKHNEQKKA